MAKVILVVDDDDDVRDITEMMITDLGYEAVLAPDGFAALRVLEDQTVDAMITDIRMPGMDGYQLAEKVRKLKPRLPVICFSAYAHLSAGARHCEVFMRKPFTSV